MKTFLAIAAMTTMVACGPMMGQTTGTATGTATGAATGTATAPQTPRIETAAQFRTTMVGRTLTSPTGDTYEIGADGRLLGGTIGTWEWRGGYLCIDRAEAALSRCYEVDTAGTLSPRPGLSL